MRGVTAALAPLLLVGCSKMAVDGTVLDANGQPIAGAMVTAMGTPCTTQSQADGTFSLECQPAAHDLVISAEGYTTEDFSVEALERKRYDIGKKILIKIPDERGLHLLQDGSYTTMKAGFLERRLEKDGLLTHRAMCLNPERGEPNKLGSGVHAMFDFEHPGWRPFKLDPEGCAYRDTKDEKLKWTVEYREKAATETREVNQGKTIVLMELAPGDYFIADWDKGFFNAADTKADRHSYTGYWLRVE